jgi:hypothetical protein
MARDAKAIADTARTVVDSIASRVNQDSSSRFSSLPQLKAFVREASQRILRTAIEKFDVRQPEKFLPIDHVDEWLRRECQALLEESLAKPDLAATITTLIELDQVMTGVIERATPDLLQCGGDCRTFLFIPNEEAYGTVVEKLRASRPLAAVMSANVEDVVVVSEVAGISPRSLASALERVFPGIAEAAHRLFTRVDIEWQSLL